MKVFSKILTIEMNVDEVKDITPLVERCVDEAKIRDGFVNIFVKGSTAALTTIEYESGVIKDLFSIFEKYIPKGRHWEHEKAWHDGNAHSHLRAAILKPNLTVPIKDGKLFLGTWQQIVVLNLDVRKREREILVQVIG